MKRKNPKSDELDHLIELLEKGVILRDGEGTIDLDSNDEVWVGLAFDVTSFGPHNGTIYVNQNRYHSHPDIALQGAVEILEEWMMENEKDIFDDLYNEIFQEKRDKITAKQFREDPTVEEEAMDEAWQEAYQQFYETIDGRTFGPFDPEELVDAMSELAGADYHDPFKYISVFDEDGEVEFE